MSSIGPGQKLIIQEGFWQLNLQEGYCKAVEGRLQMWENVPTSILTRFKQNFRCCIYIAPNMNDKPKYLHWIYPIKAKKWDKFCLKLNLHQGFLNLYPSNFTMWNVNPFRPRLILNLQEGWTYKHGTYNRAPVYFCSCARLMTSLNSASLASL